MHGLPSRRYTRGLEPVGQDVEPASTSKSAVDRWFIAETKKALEEVTTRSLAEQRYPVLMIDGIEMDAHVVAHWA